VLIVRVLNVSHLLLPVFRKVGDPLTDWSRNKNLCQMSVCFIEFWSDGVESQTVHK